MTFMSSCPICGEFANSMPLHLKTSSRYFDNSSHKIIRCSVCSGCYWHPTFSSKEMQLYYSDDYPEFIDRQINKRNSLYKRRLINISRYCSKGKLLDVGAGIGSFLDLASTEGWEIDGVEMSSNAIAIAHKLYNISLRNGSLEDQSFPSNYFDVVHLNHVLEHIPSPHFTLREIFRIIKKGGIIVIEVPNEIDSLQGIIAEHFKNFTGGVRESGLHLTFMNPYSVSLICKQNGFTELQINTFYSGCSYNFNRFRSNLWGVRELKYMLNLIGGFIDRGPLVEYYGIK